MEQFTSIRGACSAFAVLVGIAALAGITGCGVSQEEVPRADSPTAAPQVAPTVRGAGQLAQTTPTATAIIATATSSSSPHPRPVELEDLIDLCDSIKPDLSDGGVRMIGYERAYDEIDRNFEFVHEQYVYVDINSDDDVRMVIKGKDDVKYFEYVIVDGIQYSPDDEGEWQAVRVNDWPPTEKESPPAAGPGGSTGGTGPTGQVDDESSARSDEVCGHSIDQLSGAKDYGTEVLNGVEVRHVAIFLGPELRSTVHDGAEEFTKEFWVDPDGKTVQRLESSIHRGEFLGGFTGRRRVDTLWTFPDVVPPPITAPEISATPTGQ